MNLIKQLNDHANKLQLQSLNLACITIDRMQFRQLIESLSLRDIVSKPLVPTLKHESDQLVWSNNVDHFSLVVSGQYSKLSGDVPMDLTINGTKTQIIEVMSILDILRVQTPANYRSRIMFEADVEYHTALNPVMWSKEVDEYVMNSEIESTLLAAAEKFVEFLKVPKVKIVDITLTGSCANYNWTSSSDIDLHVVVDMKKSVEEYGELLPEFFDAKKRVWNDLHDIKIKNIPVEFYVQDQDEKHHSTGIYSLQDSKWINTPTHNPPTIDDIAVKEKVAALIKEIDAACTSNKASVIETLHTKLVQLRKRGLERGGEFSTENVVFKQLRSKGYLDKLAECKVKAFDRELSIEEEEWVK